MAEVSKYAFEKACTNLECYDFLHPWSNNCLMANAMCCVDSIKGSYRFYAYVYLIQMGMRGGVPSPAELRALVCQYAASGALGFLVSASTCTFNCVMRHMVLGRFTFYTFVMLPNMLNGLAIFLEPPGRRGLVVNLFANLLIEHWLRRLEKAGIVSITPARMTFLFMIGSSALFYLMRLEGDRMKRTPLLWFFTPEKVKKDLTNNNEKDNKGQPSTGCPHAGPCWEHVLKGAGKLFGAGCVIAAARAVLPKITAPMKALGSLKRTHLRLALFLGGYIGVYRAMICLLCRVHGRDNALHAIPAGFLAGTAFRWNPGMAFSIASVTGAMKLLSTILYEKKWITEKVPIPELMFCVSQGMLYHARFFHTQTCPGYIFKLMDTVSNGCTKQIYEKMLEAVKRAQ